MLMKDAPGDAKISEALTLFHQNDTALMREMLMKASLYVTY